MIHGDAVGLLLGAVALGAVHGVEPGHGWPVAASYALDQSNKWLYGLAASFLLGVGHLVSSIAMVAVFFYAKAYFDLTQVNSPITVAGGVEIGGLVSLVAGVLLIALGVREYRHGHSHGGHDHADGSHTEHGHTHGNNADPGHSHDHHGHASEEGHSRDRSRNHGDDAPRSAAHADSELWSRVKDAVPFVGGHSHAHDDRDEVAERGLWGIAWFAFLLGFAHEEEFEIIALCAGSTYCLELMSAYALTVVLGIVGVTALLIAGYEHHEETVERYTQYLPAFSAAVLVLMGAGFITGLF
ncbi:hypothetical protein ACOZ4I_18360 (plasmid) [Haloarcula salina]|uniref:hypothetical protein n=1 Tax=Haloarcula salina TaxID=1429914 RepID=UPI003C703149